MMVQHRSPWRITLASIALFSLVFTADAAVPKYRPKAGLWQIDSQTALFGHVVPDVGMLVGVGPQALQDHVASMLRQNRIRLNGDGSASACLTEQQIATNRYANDYGSGCIVGKGRRKGNSIYFDITCGAPKGTGHAEVRLLGSKHWQAFTHLSLSIRGITQEIDNISDGSWVADRCPSDL